MIEFDCPECGALNEVSDRKAGRRVRCVECDERIDVPGERRKKPKPILDGKPAEPDRLSQQEYLLYGLLFLLAPVISVVVSSVLYYVWKSSLPTKAYQINQLGWAVFGIHMLPLCTCCCIGIFVGPPNSRRRR